MGTSRRNFLKTAAIATPALAITGSVHGMTGYDNSGHAGQLISDHSNDSGWLNARECGASGSTFQTTGVARSGSRQINVADIGDFKVGQGVMVSKCNIRYEKIQMWSTGIPYVTDRRPVENSFEVRGYDGTAGSWMIYVLDIPASSKPAFRWSEDLGRNWHDEVPMTHGWQSLSGGVEVKFNEKDWEAGYVVAFGARDQLVTRIEKIEGNVLTLQDEANRDVDDAVVRHNDTFALQEAVNRGIREKLNVFVPVGHYMLAKTIQVKDADAITIEGASSVDTVLDIGEGEGPCFTLEEGTEVNLRNFRLLGFMGFDEADRAGSLPTRGARYIWGFALKYCCAVDINNTERVLVENCHASKMSGECFVAGGQSRGTTKPGRPYTQWITYRRCSVTDSARNAFNDTMHSVENTSVLNCRIIDVGGCTWESASRFVKFTGNYIRNSGPVAIGNLGEANREANKVTPENINMMYPALGAGQHVVADNVFEGNVSYGGRFGGNAIHSTWGATQVIIRNNLFINFNSSGISARGHTDATHYASANTIITGNIFDLTCIGQKSILRTAIAISSNDIIVSDNQIYVRGSADPLVTAINLFEPVLNVNIHDNLIRNCGKGLVTERAMAGVAEAKDKRTFKRLNNQYGLPQDRIRPWSVNGWILLWKDRDGKLTGTSIIESFDPETLSFTLREPLEMKAGDQFDVLVTSFNWTIHNNLVTDCLRPVVLDSYGSRTSVFKNNLVARGNTSKVPVAMEVHGSFQLVDNRFTDFNEDKSVAVALYPDAIGRVCNSQYMGNIFENCNGVISESQPGLWKGSMRKDNQAIECLQKLPK